MVYKCRLQRCYIHVWYIYLDLVDFFMVNVGKYTSPMDPMGMPKKGTWASSPLIRKDEITPLFSPFCLAIYRGPRTPLVVFLFYPSYLWKLKMEVWIVIFLFNWVIFWGSMSIKIGGATRLGPSIVINGVMGAPTWRTIPVSKCLITMVSKSPKWGCSPSKWPKWLINGSY